MTNRILHYRLPLSIFIYCITVLTIQAQTWTSQTSGVTTNLGAVSFVSPTQGWAAGDAGVLLKTTDAGLTWTPQTVGFTTRCAAVSFVSPTHGWVVDASLRIRATTDGGNTWVSQTSATSFANNDVCFVSPTVGWIVSGQVIQKTINGGATWTLQNTNFTANISKCFFISATHGWVIGYVFGSSPVQHVILRTTDGGATWAVASPNTSNQYLRDIHFTSTMNGYACAGGGVIKTTDGGATWAAVGTYSSQLFQGIYFQNATNGWTISYQGNIRATNDGGITWRTEPSGVTTGLNKIVVSGENGFIVGASGRIIATNNASNVAFPVPTLTSPIEAQVMDNACNNGTTNSADWQFSWGTVSGATSYEVSALGSNGIELFSAETTNLTYNYSSATAIPVQGYSCRVRAKFAGGGVSDWSTLIAVTVEPINYDCQPPFVSFQSGSWSEGSTWVGGVIPTAANDVIIESGHTITIPTTGISVCRDLTVNGTINNIAYGGFLQCFNNMTISNTGSYNGGGYIPPAAYVAVYTGGGVLAIAASKALQGNSTGTSPSPPNNKTVTINGGIFQGFVILAGRIVATNNATINLKGGDYIGWLDPNNSTPQYIVEADNTSTVTIDGGTYLIRPNGTKPHFSPTVILTSATPSCPSGTVFQNIGVGGDYSFGASDRDQTMNSINTINGAIINSLAFNRMKVSNLSFYTSGVNSKTLTSTNSKFVGLSVYGANTTMKGVFELINGCTNNAPNFGLTNTTTGDNTFGLNVNVTDTAMIDLGGFAANQSFNVLGSFNIQNGKVVVKGGTLDLTNATVTGLDEQHYFITKPNFDNTKMGKVILPPVGSTLKTFNLGLSIPNGNNPPTSIYTPLSIISNSGSSNVTINVQTLTAPTGYVAPTIQWDITPTAGSNLTITFTWPPSAESPAFAAQRVLGNAKIYHYNSTSSMWELLTSTPVTTNLDGSFSITATGITSFSPFAVMAPSPPPLAVELTLFTAKAINNKTTLTWQTANETNAQNFDIEKSLDGKNFIKIKEVKANNTPSVYQAFDDNFTESAYYRLKINDLDGKTDYSKTVFVAYNKAQKLQIFPNPVKDKITILGASKDDFKITDLLGRVILRGTLSDNQTEVDVSALPSGLYLLQTTEAVEKFLKE
jgi:photosystem II stability/assembly factor-like uncharacterized protein